MTDIDIRLDQLLFFFERDQRQGFVGMARYVFGYVAAFAVTFLLVVVTVGGLSSMAVALMQALAR
jgi:hypothetical protein